jgi:hypothetical protein
MPKNEQQKKKDYDKSVLEKEKYLKKEIYRYNAGTLRKDELHKISIQKANEYLKNELKKKYKTDVSFHCFHCATNLLYDNGCVSDDELLVLPNVKQA